MWRLGDHAFNLGRVTLTLGLAIAGMRCSASNDVAVEERTSGLTVPWLYYPLATVQPGYAGYCGYWNGSSCSNTHDAYDLKGNLGDTVYAPAEGDVWVQGSGCAEASGCTSDGDALAACGGSCGNWLTIAAANGLIIKMCHFHAISVGNVHVLLGQPIGTVGHTGSANTCNSGFVSHLHFALASNRGSTPGYIDAACTVGNHNNNCIDPGAPPGAPPGSCACATTPPNQWVTNGSTVVLAKSKLATVNVAVSTGAGTVTVWRNGNETPIGSTTSSRAFYFNIGDTYTFEASPNPGNSFAKFCGDTACSITTSSNPFSGTITASSGNVFAYFNACVPDSDNTTCFLAFKAFGAPVCGSGWTNNCGQDVTCHCSSSTTQTCDTTPGSPTQGTCVNRSGAVYGFYDAYAGCVPNCSGKSCGDDSCGGYCGSGTGSCAAGYVCSGGNCVMPPATCPTGTCNTSNATGWCGAGYYCNTSGIANGAANTLYYCSSAGGYATSPRYCNEECHFRPGLNDQCWEDTSSCYYWRNYNVYACGWDSVNGNPRIDYSCHYGSKSIHQWCAPGRCAWGSVNDYCY